MFHKRLSGILIACLVLVAANPTANGDTLSEEQKEVLITGLLEKGYKQDEIPGLIELAGLAGGPSISKEARNICLKILIASAAVTEKTDNQQQKRAIGVAYEIVKAEDISYPGKKRMNYKIVVSPEIKRHQVEPTVKTIIAHIIAKDRGIDDICLWLYSDRKLASHGGYDVAMALWTPDNITINVKKNLEGYLRQRGKSEVKFGFTEDERHQIYKEIYAAERRADAEAEEMYPVDFNNPHFKQGNVPKYTDKNQELMEKYKAQVRVKYGITEKTGFKISVEAIEEGWPDR